MRVVDQSSDRRIRDAGRAAIICAATLLGGCATGAPGETERGVRAMLDRQVLAWNAGEVEVFMEPYWRSDELTFTSGGQIRRGWNETRARFRERYPDRAAMGRLSFSDLEITPLGREAALVLGRWRLERDHGIRGVFTLVCRRVEGQWLIIHDHTSMTSD